MPVFKRLKETNEAISSVLAQKYEDLNLILVDDNIDQFFIDATFQDSKRDGRIIYVKNDKYPHGIMWPKNLGLEMAQKLGSDYVAYLDNDDKYHPNNLQEKISFLEKNQNIAIIWSHCNVIDQDGTFSNRIMDFPEHHKDILRSFRYTCPIWNSASVFRAELISTIWLQDEKFIVAADFDWLLRVLHSNKGYNIQESLIDYRIRDNNFTTQSGLQNHRDAVWSLKDNGRYLGANYYRAILMHWLKTKPLLDRIANKAYATLIL